MTATTLLAQLQRLGVELQVSGDRLRFKPAALITPDLHSEMAKHKGELIALLTARPAPAIHTDERCPLCAATVLVRELPTRFELECESDPLHYSEHRRKPGSDRLWVDLPTQEESRDARHLHYALEGRSIFGAAKTGACEVGCGNEIPFYFLDGVGYGYCPGCKVHQQIGESIR